MKAETTEQVAPNATFGTDREHAKYIPVSVSFLQKDRRSPSPQIPFIRIGDKIVYDIPAVIQHLKAQQHGGRRRGAR